MTAMQQLTFDYGTLDAETRIVVQQRTAEIKSLMKRAAQDIIEIGQKLKEVQSRLAYGYFGAWLRAEFDWSESLATKVMQVACRFSSVNFTDLSVAPSALYLLAAPSTPEPARHEAIERAEAGEPITYSKARQIVNEYKEIDDLLETANEAVIHHTQPMASGAALDLVISLKDAASATLETLADRMEYDGDEWYTPAEYIEAARDVMGGIDLDPASCHAAQRIVEATEFYTVDRNGLALPWSGRVWMNPPYSMPLIAQFVKRAIDFYEAGDVQQAIILTNNCTDAGWFHSLIESYPVCFTRGRIPFWRPDRSTFATRQGQAFFYLGPNVGRFAEVFEQFGVVVQAL